MPIVLAPSRTITRTSCPSATSWRVTWLPRYPLAPMTSFGFVLISGSPYCRSPCGGLIGQRAEFFGLAAPLRRRRHEPQRVVDVLLAAPLAVAGVGDDRDVGGADDRAVAGVAHRVVQLADDPAGRLVDDRPQRGERGHVAAGEGLHRLPDPGPHLFAAAHDARRVLDVNDVGAVLLDPWIPVAGLGGAGHRLLEVRERLGQLVAGEHLARHGRN